MTKREFCQLWLTCKDKAEADKIAKALLRKHLIACAKQIQASSDFRWRGKVDHSKEILLLMDSRLNLFEKTEAEITKLHSYNTFVLQAVPVAKVSKEAAKWLGEETNA